MSVDFVDSVSRAADRRWYNPPVSLRVRRTPHDRLKLEDGQAVIYFIEHEYTTIDVAALVSLVSFRGMTHYRIMITNAFSGMTCAYYSANKTRRNGS